jgi:hypothetical protein
VHNYARPGGLRLVVTGRDGIIIAATIINV